MNEMNETILKTVHAHRWTRRLLTTGAIGIGLLSIIAGVLIAVANSKLVMPMERLLYQSYPGTSGHSDMNNPAWPQPKQNLTRDQLDARHVEVTFAHGKELFVIAMAVALVGLGTFLTLLLVIFNRRITLRQINRNLALISDQMKALQRDQGAGLK